MSLPSADDTKHQFMQLAVQYFVAGRSAAINQLLPVLGNLLHHSVEMALKAALAASLTMPELKALGHNLPRIWGKFKVVFPGTHASPFDAVIEALHRFEELRYPDSILKHGAMIELALFREHVGTAPSSAAPVPRYTLVLEDVDALHELIFDAARINPRAFSGSMSESAKQQLFLHNRHASKW